MTYAELISRLIRIRVCLSGIGEIRKEAENRRLLEIGRKLLADLINDARCELVHDALIAGSDDRVQH